jgi:hypothetical protein
MLLSLLSSSNPNMSPYLLILNVACMGILTKELHLYRQYQSGKAISMISLTDLVNGDLISTFYANMLSICSTQIWLHLDLTLPDLLAEIVVALSRICYFSLMLYLTTSPVIQYLHTVYKRTSLIPGITDVDAQRLVRTLTVCFSLILQGPRVASEDRATMFKYLTRSGEEAPGSIAGVSTSSVLGVVALVINLTLRALITIEKRRSENRLGLNSSRKISKKLFGNLLLVLSMLIPMIVYSLISSSLEEGENYFRRRQIFIVYGSLFIPFMFVLSDGKIF